MPFQLRPRRLATAALTVAAPLLFAACSQFPENVFHNRTEFNRQTTWLFLIIIYIGTAVFIFVEGLLIWTMIKYRNRPGAPEPEHVHGNTKLEIAWTAIPAIILLGISVPTVQTIFRTEGKAAPGALHVQVIGHQWWWEFRYSDYNGVITANELYLPEGRTVEFRMSSADVIHSFWIPGLGGKRDVMPDSVHHTNYLWFTPDSAGTQAWNGVCVEYCGSSHANMRFRAFTVTPADFESWVKNQELNAAVLPPPPAPANAPPALPANAGVKAAVVAATTPPAPAGAAGPATVMQAGFTEYPLDKIPDYAKPNTPVPNGLTFDETLKGDAMRGAALMTGKGMCLSCHSIKGNPMMVGQIGPNLTHVASRTTLAGALFPNTPKYMELWVKNARLMKPGVVMNTFGLGQIDPQTGQKVTFGLSDQEIADIVSYLQLLK